jgi:hypothetical protein
MVGGLFAFLPDPFQLNASRETASTTSENSADGSGAPAPSSDLALLAIRQDLRLRDIGSKQAAYARLAALVSVLAFLVGYDPTRIEELFNLVPVVGANHDKTRSREFPAANANAEEYVD